MKRYQNFFDPGLCCRHLSDLNGYELNFVDRLFHSESVEVGGKARLEFPLKVERRKSWFNSVYFA